MHLREAPSEQMMRPDTFRVTADAGARLHSRSIRAGYDPGRLHAARVLVVGLGALGQNVLQNLTLSGVGNLLLIDFDEFEDHNATRSPFYPTAADRAAGPGAGSGMAGAGSGGLAKAPVVAAQVAARSTAPEPAVRYVEGLVQQAGDGPIRWAEVVVSAVDSNSARAWLAERCRVHGRPMVEGGFSGPDFNLVAFSGATGAPCYRCHSGARASSASCTQYALAAEAASIIPAIQTTAAVLGGLMSEQVIQILHGDFDRFGRQIFGNVRRLELRTTWLQTNPECPGQHAVLPVLAELPPPAEPAGGAAPATLGELVTLAGTELGPGWLMLAEPAIIAQPCTRCTTLCRVRATEAAWLRRPRCVACGGPWPRSAEPAPDAVQLLPLGEPPPDAVAAVPLAALGLGPAGAVQVQDRTGRTGLLTLPGSATEAAHPAP